MLLPECNRLSLLINIIWTLSVVAFLYVHWSGGEDQAGAEVCCKFWYGAVQPRASAGSQESCSGVVRGCRGCAGRRRRWLKTGSGKIPGLSWPRPAHVETEQRRSRRKGLLGKARSQRNCRALRNTGRELGRAGAGQAEAPGVFGRLSLSCRQSRQRPTHQEERSMCKAGIRGPSVRGQQGTWRANPCMDRGVKDLPASLRTPVTHGGAGTSCHCGQPGGKGA